MAKKTETDRKENAAEKAGKDSCTDKSCPTHGTLSVRGRAFEGTVIKKFPKRVVIAFEKTTYIRKYERYTKYTSKIHARLPPCMDKDINVGDYIQIRECRPLSKLIHSVVVKKIREGNGDSKKTKSRKNKK